MEEQVLFIIHLPICVFHLHAKYFIEGKRIEYLEMETLRYLS